ARIEVSAIAHDHREVAPGTLFVARRGERHDAHDHLVEAAERGAVAAIGEREAPGLQLPYLVVPDARRALPHLAAAFYAHPSERLRVIGVTGTDGKTTTSYLLHWLLALRFTTGLVSTAGIRLGAPEGAGDQPADDRVFQLAGHFTTPEATDVQRLLSAFATGGASHAVLESSSHGFSLNRLDAVAYDVGIVTNLSSEHLDHHGSMAEYLAAKATLVERARLSHLNLDDPHHPAFAAAARAAGNTLRGYGESPGADLRIGAVSDVRGGLQFTLARGDAEVEVQLPTIGRYNAWNAAAAVAAASEEGIGIEEAAARLALFPGVPGRMQLIAAEPFTVVVDFAHTAPALAKALAAVRPAVGRVVVVIGAAGERDPGKRAPLGAAAVRGADLVVFTEEDSRSEPFAAIADELVRGAQDAGGRRGSDFVVVAERERAIATALAAAREGDVVLLAGKGHERTLERADQVIDWDEAALT